MSNRTAVVLLTLISVAILLFGLAIGGFSWVLQRLPPPMEWAIGMSSERIAQAEPGFFAFALTVTRALGGALLALGVGLLVLMPGIAAPEAARRRRAVFAMIGVWAALATLALLAHPTFTPWFVWAAVLALAAAAWGILRRNLGR